VEPVVAKKEAESGKQEAKQQAFDALKGGKPRSIVIDTMVFCGGIGSLVWVLHAMAPT
jgi:hypothetical protein